MTDSTPQTSKGSSTCWPNLSADMVSLARASSAPRWHIHVRSQEILELVFQRHPFPGAETWARLGRELHVSSRQIQVWFQNRRQKEKKRSAVAEPRSQQDLSQNSAGQSHTQCGQPLCTEEAMRERQAPEGMSNHEREGRETTNELSVNEGHIKAHPLAAQSDRHPHKVFNWWHCMNLHEGSTVQVMTEALPPFRVLAVTDNWSLLCGYSRDEILGKSLSILQGPLTSRATLRELMSAVYAGRPVTVELTNYNKHGRTFDTRLTVEPLRASEFPAPMCFLSTMIVLRMPGQESQSVPERTVAPTAALSVYGKQLAVPAYTKQAAIPIYGKQPAVLAFTPRSASECGPFGERAVTDCGAYGERVSVGQPPRHVYVESPSTSQFSVHAASEQPAIAAYTPRVAVQDNNRKRLAIPDCAKRPSPSSPDQPAILDFDDELLSWLEPLRAARP